MSLYSLGDPITLSALTTTRLSEVYVSSQEQTGSFVFRLAHLPVEQILTGSPSLMTFLLSPNRGDVAVINASDPQTWVMEQVLSGAGGRTLATNRGHTDIVRCAHLNVEVSSLLPGLQLREKSSANIRRRIAWFQIKRLQRLLLEVRTDKSVSGRYRISHTLHYHNLSR